MKDNIKSKSFTPKTIWSIVGKILTVITILTGIMQLRIWYSDKGYQMEASIIEEPYKLPSEILNDTISQFENYITHLSIEVENVGDKPLENLKIETSTNGSYELQTPTSNLTSKFKKTISIGNLNPSYCAKVEIWSIDKSAETITITHNNGYKKIEVHGARRIDIYTLIILSTMGILVLLFFLLFLVVIYQKRMLAHKFYGLNAEIKRLKKVQNPLDKKSRIENIATLKLLIKKERDAKFADKQWIFNETCLVHDYTLESKYQIAIDTYCNPTEWQIQLFGRNEKSEQYLFETLHNSLFSFDDTILLQRNGNRIIFREYSTESKVEEISLGLKELLSKLNNFIDQRN